MNKVIILIIISITIMFFYNCNSVNSNEEINNDEIKENRPWIPETTKLDKNKHLVDNIDLNFINDNDLIGEWKSVDFIENIEDFNPDLKLWEGELYLKELIFYENGITFESWWTWTKGFIIHSGDNTASNYTIKVINNIQYLFFEWKSGDYTIRYMKPSYYVLIKI